MNLSLTDEQLLLKDTFARLFAKESSIARVRLNSETQFDADLWANLVDTGAPMARVPVASGGLGMSLLDAAIIAEEAGRRLASAPLIEVIVAGRLLSEFRDESGWLQKIADGAIVAVAIDEPVEGCSQLVPGGRHAEAIPNCRSCDGPRRQFWAIAVSGVADQLSREDRPCKRRRSPVCMGTSAR
jgi:3-oxochol-4-en-24-oyl-CoA dehydrogenase